MRLGVVKLNGELKDITKIVTKVNGVKKEVTKVKSKSDSPIEPLIFHDDFNRADSNTLGGIWQNVVNTFGIVGNTAKMINPNNTAHIAIIDVGIFDNMIIETNLYPGSSDGIVFEYVNNLNYIHVSAESGTLYLKMYQNGEHIVLGSYIAKIIKDTPPFKMRVELRRENLKFFVDDVFQFEYSFPRLKNTSKVGMRSWGINEKIGSFDDFTVSRLI